MSVYFVRQANDAGLIKIGYTDDSIKSRLSTLQTASPEPLTLLCAVPGSRDEETALHARFAPYRRRGEWFEPSSELLEYIAAHQTLVFGRWFEGQQGRGDLIGALSREICVEGPMWHEWAACRHKMALRDVLPISVYVSSSMKACAAFESARMLYRRLFQ